MMNEMDLTKCTKQIMTQYFSDVGDISQVTNLYDFVINQVERQLIISVLKNNNGNKVQTAKMLGINRNTLYKKILNLDIDN